MRRRSILAGTMLAGLIAGASCGDPPGTAVSAATFSPNPASAADGRCGSELTVVSSAGRSFVLQSMTFSFADAAGKSASIVYGTGELLDTFDSLVVPAFGTARAAVTFDLAALDLTAPVEVAVVLVGAGPQGTAQFVGALACRA